MIARLSQTTQSPSHRIGTLPSDGRELVAFAALLPFVVEHRHDEFLELLARLLARRASRASTSSNKRDCR